ncbi:MULTISPECIES: alpha-2-macroglobulin family protein [unclassified Cupriavidus]|uniref:alpha-2-macroglobulin family protein n=1 Tax=unclassified Cupriavidus TaxID=2640874 RepID=UPI003F91BA81
MRARALLRSVTTRMLLALALLAWTHAAGADQRPGATLDTVPSSGYAAFQGQPFFLLSDASFGSDQTAQVRLEAPGREYKSELQRYGGADILVYRVADPVAFLKGQKNLHRIDVKASYRGEGLANTLSYLWDSWYKQARRAWQRVLSLAARSKAVEDAPQFSMGDQIAQPTRFENNPQYEPLKGYDLVERFRYPIWDAREIAPPRDVKLEGSSSEFLPRDAGNVMVPLGKLRPGLYIVEGIIGTYRAHTLLFVSDTVAITKSTANGMLAWAANRKSGRPVAGASLAWTDGLGVLQSASTGADGAAELAHTSPERSYLLGVDPAGGAFISENFYYDSEIYNTKLYAFTDRPLYRPGDEVRVKFIGRNFRSATESAPAAAGDIRLDVLDPNGAPLAALGTALNADNGADARFTLPANALAGGYTLRFDYGGNTYGGAFRVAEYIKPHFDVNLALDKADYATGEAVKGKIELRYPDGKPVKDARLSVSLRAQQVTMVEGELQYAGLFPLKLEQQELTTDGSGNAALALPAAKDPSRYVVTVFANDGAAYRVKVTRELLIARGATPYKLTAPANFTNAGQSVTFWLQALDATAQAPARAPARWELVRLESRTRTEGRLDAGAIGAVSFPVRFDQPGSYTLSVKDGAGNLLAAASHWVAGDGLQTVPGNIEIVFDRDRYRIGDTAEALVTFPLAVEDALLTLERDRVERRGLLSKGGDWLSLEKITDKQWRARIKVGNDFSPNMTFSVLYVKDGDYVFQNAGIAVLQPAIELAVKSDKAVYAPGDTVTLDLGSAFNGKPVPANLTVSVVDEMVYVLQPEIAPSIVDFFYHPRRNSVRTTSSLNFIGYDLATSGQPGAGGPERGRYNERGVKVLERPRRDDKDTAAWEANLRTGADGRARMSFTMPDSLTRWRITVRAMASDGMVGQRTASIRSDKSLYLKWTGPQRYRAEDAPRIDMVAFNQGEQDVAADLVVMGAGLNVNQSVTLKRGANYVRLPVAQGALQSGVVNAEIKLQGKTVDRLQAALAVEPTGWLSQRELTLPLAGASAVLKLPADAQDVRLRFVDSAASHFARVADDLLAYPYGCTEQTASRLIPLALAQRSLAASGASTGGDTQGLDALLRTQRQRLALLAGVNGQFGWWGDTLGNSALLTAYAYYADWLATRAVGISLPPDHWKRTLEAYKQAMKEPLLHRTLALWFINEMGLPVATQLSGVAAELGRPGSDAGAAVAAGDSLVFAAPDSAQGRRVATVLAAQLYKQIGQPMPEGLAGAADAARQALAADPSPLVQSLLLMSGKGAAASDVQALLSRAGAASPTIDRAVTLVWLNKALGGGLGRGLPGEADAGQRTPQGSWKAARGQLGLPEWRWTGAQLPESLTFSAPPNMEAAAQSYNTNAVVSYRSRAQEAARLPIGIERKLYRLVPTSDSAAKADKAPDPAAAGTAGLTFTARAVKPGDKLDSNTLYVDEIVLSPRQGVYRYGLVEAPLPPGGEVEGTTWGLRIEGLPDPDNKTTGLQPFQRAVTYETGMLSYHQPVVALERPVVLRQLVRFSLPGRFSLPPVRYFRMYQPDAKALQGDGKSAAFPLTVE